MTDSYLLSNIVKAWIGQRQTGSGSSFLSIDLFESDQHKRTIIPNDSTWLTLATRYLTFSQFTGGFLLKERESGDPSIEKELRAESQKRFSYLFDAVLNI